ncbi:preprotein translocase subunit YajC [Candidatus Odyssella acanthamoebae]|uniref:Sec translocon accessory complex subunit YajC n=1 Tax=Candidatus Odyssella acanthamoebae TaxID=91604 RepID=A0A077ARF5_9PROT|nr:preprotein translocase subunit YajC [Candidatus Paracaedibacter acanthamoebae]AIK95782.1 membrane protein [Candidatus Paracaedibacter acanthamoebae]
MSPGGFDIMSFLPLLMIFVIFYFLLIRPQQRKMKEQQAMLGAVRRGDKVVTSGGLIGTVSKVNSDTEVLLEIAENVKVRVVKSMISEVLSKTEAVNSDEMKAVEPKATEKKASSKKTTKAKTVVKKD